MDINVLWIFSGHLNSVSFPWQPKKPNKGSVIFWTGSFSFGRSCLILHRGLCRLVEKSSTMVEFHRWRILGLGSLIITPPMQTDGKFWLGGSDFKILRDMFLGLENMKFWNSLEGYEGEVQLDSRIQVMYFFPRRPKVCSVREILCGTKLHFFLSERVANAGDIKLQSFMLCSVVSVVLSAGWLVDSI